MFSTFAVAAFSFFTVAQSFETLSCGNLSTTAYATPKALALSTTSSTRGLGEYILAALGVTSSASSTSTPNGSFSYNTATNTFPNASYPTPVGNVSAHIWAPVRSDTSETSGPKTYCAGPSVCYTDIDYSAISVDPTGSGSAYASRCAEASWSFAAVSSSWGRVHSSVSTQTVIQGGTSWKSVTYYKDAYTLCDGHARVTSSPAIPISSGILTFPATPTATSYIDASVGWAFPVSSPVCSIKASDCDPLWSAFTTSAAQWSAQQTGAANAPQITKSPMKPPCANSSAIAAQSSANAVLTGCGKCTIFGQNVQLVYFPVPTTVSRDMCASTPSSPVTWYDKDVVSIYNGSGPAQTDSAGNPLETAVYNGHTFTSGTAYISIESVWIGDRCTASMGTPVTNAVLAMPSESVLSLRYRQNHFQYFYNTIATITGYPFNFADMNEPIPFSAYQGQQFCQYENYVFCDVIYDKFNPQLAMPPGIRKLRPEWADCEMWYGGLYDPPMALKPGTALATATIPHAAATTTAEPTQTIPTSTPRATALQQTEKSTAASADQPAGGAQTGNGNQQAATTTIAGAGNNAQNFGNSQTNAEGGGNSGNTDNHASTNQQGAGSVGNDNHSGAGNGASAQNSAAASQSGSAAALPGGESAGSNGQSSATSNVNAQAASHSSTRSNNVASSASASRTSAASSSGSTSTGSGQSAVATSNPAPKLSVAREHFIFITVAYCLYIFV